MTAQLTICQHDDQPKKVGHVLGIEFYADPSVPENEVHVLCANTNKVLGVIKLDDDVTFRFHHKSRSPFLLWS